MQKLPSFFAKVAQKVDRTVFTLPTCMHTIPTHMHTIPTRVGIIPTRMRIILTRIRTIPTRILDKIRYLIQFMAFSRLRAKKVQKGTFSDFFRSNPFAKRPPPMASSPHQTPF